MSLRIWRDEQSELAPDWFFPVRIEDKSLLYLATTRALECVLLIPCYHFGLVFSDPTEAHFFAARNAPHRRDPPFIDGCLLDVATMVSIRRARAPRFCETLVALAISSPARFSQGP
jgi:hypothetical protein